VKSPELHWSSGSREIYKMTDAKTISNTGENFLFNLFNKIKKQRLSGLVLLLLIILTGLSLARPDTFFQQQNLFNILKQVSIVTIVAVGQTFIIVSGGIDLSVGFSLGLSGVIMAFCLKTGMPLPLAITTGMVTGTLVGALNGLVITKFRLPPFIATLGMAKIARGIMYVITKGYPIPVKNEFIFTLGNGYIGPFPILTIVMVLIVIAGAYIMSSTVFGNTTKAIGGNELAARLSGISVEKNKVMLYALTGLLCGIGGILLSGRVNSGNPNAGLNFDLDSIAAVIVGGTAMSGGEGTIIGTVLGALILGVIKNGLILMNVSMYWQTVITGIIIITVCAIDAATHKKD
jgi:ribose transport system permease protein